MLPVRSFNLNVVNAPIESLFPPDSFSKVFQKAFEFFQTIEQVSNPLIFLSRPSGGQVQLNPVGFFSKDIQTERFDEDLQNLFQIINVFHSECKISELKEINLRLVFYSKAIIVNQERKLLAYDILIPDELFRSFPDGKVHTGLRFVFTAGVTRYDLKIEPRFANLDENYIDFNVRIPKPIKTEDAYNIVTEQRNFFDNRILPIIAR